MPFLGRLKLNLWEYQVIVVVLKVVLWELLLIDREFILIVEE